MLRKKYLLAVLFSVTISQISCVNDVKDAIDESVNAIECANLLQQINEEQNDRPCAEIISDIDNILNICDEFLSQEEKDNLNFARNNCQDN